MKTLTCNCGHGLVICKSESDTKITCPYCLRSVYVPAEEPPALGITWLWALPDTHPFYPAAVWHDAQYDLLKPTDSTAAIDLECFERFKVIAADNTKLLVEAYFFYVLMRIWGIIRQIRGYL